MDNFSFSTQGRDLLLVEDDTELASLVQEYLSKNDFTVTVIANGLDAAQHILAHQPDLVILDIMLPGQSGMDVCKKVRPKYAGPILMLTALDEDMDQMLGLELGADDYIIKPVQPRLLLTRIRALLRRLDKNAAAEPSSLTKISSSQALLSIGNLEINLANRSVSMSDVLVELTTAEFDLLLLLAESVGQVVSRDKIIQTLRGFDYDGMDRSIDRRISRLRKKLADDPEQPVLIKTVRGKGYQLCHLGRPEQ